jgi:hypothetical protein
MDPIGIWFEEIGKYFGENIEIPFCRYDAQTDETEWFHLPHSEYDGFSGYAHLLSARGYDPTTFPDMRNTRRFTLALKIAALFRFFSHRCDETAVSWIRQDDSVHGRSRGIAWHIFGRDETDTIERFSVMQGASCNSFLLMTLTRAVPPFFRTHSVHGDGRKGDTWMLPVSMRKRAFVYQSEPANMTSYAEVILDEKMDIGTTHDTVKRVFKRNTYYAVWFLLRLSARCVSRRRLARFIAKKMKTAKSNTGCFSNLGRWNPSIEDDERSSHEIWFGVPPVAPGQPIGAGAMIWKGKLVLSLQVHPSIAPDFSRVEDALKCWVDTVKKITVRV